MALAKAASWAAIPRLRRLCEKALAEHISVQNCASILGACEELGAVELRAVALRYMVSHVAAVAATPGWEELASSQQPKLLETMAASLANAKEENARLREECSIVSVFTLLAGTILGFVLKGVVGGGASGGHCHHFVTLS